MMNPLLAAALGSILRHGLTAGAGWFVAHEIWTHDEATHYVAAAVVFLLTLGWSLYRKYVSRTKLVTALATDTPMSEAGLELQIKRGVHADPTTPKTELPVTKPHVPKAGERRTKERKNMAQPPNPNPSGTPRPPTNPTPNPNPPPTPDTGTRNPRG